MSSLTDLFYQQYGNFIKELSFQSILHSNYVSMQSRLEAGYRLLSIQELTPSARAEITAIVAELEVLIVLGAED